MRVAATSFNGVDGNIRAGRMQGPMPMDLPHTPGLDVAGTVDALGEGVDAPAGGRPGHRVPAVRRRRRHGRVRRWRPLPTWRPHPTSIPLADAAALPLVGLTAWQALFEHANLQAGQRILINGASGAVGGYAVQLAKSVGAYVIATASPRTRDQVTTQGADEIVDHTAGDVSAAVREPVDVLLNLAPISPGPVHHPGGRRPRRWRHRQHHRVDARPVRRGSAAYAASTCSSAATPRSWPSSPPASTGVSSPSTSPSAFR